MQLLARQSDQAGTAVIQIRALPHTDTHKRTQAHAPDAPIAGWSRRILPRRRQRRQETPYTPSMCLLLAAAFWYLVPGTWYPPQVSCSRLLMRAYRRWGSGLSFGKVGGGEMGVVALGEPARES